MEAIANALVVVGALAVFAHGLLICRRRKLFARVEAWSDEDYARAMHTAEWDAFDRAHDEWRRRSKIAREVLGAPLWQWTPSAARRIGGSEP